MGGHGRSGKGFAVGAEADFRSGIGGDSAYCGWVAGDQCTITDETRDGVKDWIANSAAEPGLRPSSARV